MKTVLRVAMVGGILLIGGLPGFAATQATGKPVGNPRITVRVYNYAEVPTATLDKAKKDAGKTFRLLGVEIIWLNCSPGILPQPESCNQPLSANEIGLRILRRPKGVEVAFDPKTGGVAIRHGEDTGSGFITLYYDRVEELAERLMMSRGLVLGHAVAHEVGHLLLPPGSHSQHGIMRAKLSGEDWQRAAKGTLLFTPQQSETILAGVLVRSSQQEAQQAASRASER